MNLDNLTPNDILTLPLPVDELVKDSVYYPACYDDGRPIKYCNTIWRSMCVNSFIYCDFAMSESRFLGQMDTVLGYHVLAHRSVSPEEYIPEGWKLELPERGREHYFDTRCGNAREFPPYAHWVVYERNADRTILHGPDRFSLLYIGGEGLAAFQQLYVSRGMAPKLLCFIQCWGLAGNWTDFTAAHGPFAMTLRRHPECTPEWVCTGSYKTIDGALHLKDTEYLGVRCIAYESRSDLERHFGRPVNIREGVSVLVRDGRSMLALSTPDLGKVLYDITDSPYDVDTLAGNLVLHERRFFSPGEILDEWVGVRYSKWTTGDGRRVPELDLRLVDPGVHSNCVTARAINIVDALTGFYRRENTRYCTYRMLDAAEYAFGILDTINREDPAVEAGRGECMSLLEHMRGRCRKI